MDMMTRIKGKRYFSLEINLKSFFACNVPTHKDT